MYFAACVVKSNTIYKFENNNSNPVTNMKWYTYKIIDVA